jgi:hypothetical protein
MNEIAEKAIAANVTSVVRGLIWLLAGWLGKQAVTNSDTVEVIAAAVGAVVGVAFSLWWSKVEKKKLLLTPPPEKDKP